MCYLAYSYNHPLQICFQEDIAVKLLEFLESPHATTDTLLADEVSLSPNECVQVFINILFLVSCTFLKWIIEFVFQERRLLFFWKEKKGTYLFFEILLELQWFKSCTEPSHFILMDLDIFEL